MTDSTQKSSPSSLSASLSLPRVSSLELQLLKDPALFSSAKKAILKEILSAVSKLSLRTCLLNKNADVLSNDTAMFHRVVEELEKEVPFLFAILNEVIGSSGSKTGTMAVIYGMIMNSRNKQCSLLQRMMSTAVIKCRGSNKLLSRLNSLHLTLSADSKRNLTKEFGKYNSVQVNRAVSDGKDGKLNGDNVDIFVRTNDIRMQNKDKDYHFFACDWTPFRLIESEFSENEKVCQMIEKTYETELRLEHFVASNTELNVFLENMAYLLGREVADNFTEFKWLNSILPKHLEHDFSEIMARKTVSYRMPILLKNEAKYDDCVDIMDSHIKQVQEWYIRAGRADDFDNLDIPYGGDQLTRVRLEGAKSLRAGAHNRIERFENVQPVIVELFHTLMDFLEKTFKRFMKTKSGRDRGTLSALKTKIQRSSVNGNVKARFAAHEDFALLTGRAYFFNHVMDFFGMEDLDSKPTKNIPHNIHNSHMKTRRELFLQLFMELARFVVGEDSSSKNMRISVNNQLVSVPIVGGNVSIKIQSGERGYQLEIPCSNLLNKKSVIVNIPGCGEFTIKQESDDLYNYIRQYLQWYGIILSFKDAIHEGNLQLININLKLMIPCFFLHSPYSKYLVECIDYISKTEHLLSPKLSLQVRISSLVNKFGGKGQNIPSDMEKEHQVKEIKKLIKGLGANKTEKSIVDISKAAPVINNIIDNFDVQIGFKSHKTSHSHSSDHEDLKVLCTELKELSACKFCPGRSLDKYQGINPNLNVQLNNVKNVFTCSVMSIAERLKRNLPTDCNEDVDD